MTVENQFPYQSFTANGSQTNFALGFYVDDKDHFEVKKNDQAVNKNEYSYDKSSNSILFNITPNQGDVIAIQRSTAADRATNYATYNNSFRPEVLNKDIDRIWFKIQELGVADALLKIYTDKLNVDQKNYVDTQDNNQNNYFTTLIQKQGISLEQLDNFYKYLLNSMANLASNKGWVASLVTDSSGKNQQEINNSILDPTTKLPSTSKLRVLNPVNALINRTLDEKLNHELASVKDGGAIGDGNLHTLQEWIDTGKYQSLSDIQKNYPTAAALTDSIDSVVIQTWVDNFKRVYIPSGIYVCNKTIIIEGSGKEIYGEAVSTYGDGNTIHTKIVHAFNGDLIKLNADSTTNPKGRHRIRGIGFISDDIKTGRAITIRSSQNHLIDLSFYKFKDGAIRVEGRSYGTYIIKPSLDQCGSNGAYDISSSIDIPNGVDAADYNTITVVADGIFESSQTGAISLHNSDPFYVMRNYIEPFNAISTQPMIEVKNSASGNTEGWLHDNYFGSLKGNGFAINATGNALFILNNHIQDFASGIFVSGNSTFTINNNIRGCTTTGIQISSVNNNVNSDFTVVGNTVRSKTNGATTGIFIGNYANGGVINSNILRGKFTYAIRLYAAINTLVTSNNILPLTTDNTAIANIGIQEDNNSANNYVAANLIQASTKYIRHSFTYDEFNLINNNMPTTGNWVKGQIVKVADPITLGALGFICTQTGSGTGTSWKKYAAIFE